MKPFRAFAFALACFLSLFIVPVFAEAPWKATFARADITPEEPVYLSGYASRDKPSDSVETPLFAKALALTDAGGHRVVLITTDVIGFSADVVEPICEAIMEATGIERADILINSSHTHTGPSLTLDPEKEGGQAQVDYTLGVQVMISQMAIEALQAEGLPAVISTGTGVVHFPMNRREWTANSGVKLGVNPRGPVDRSVPILRVAEAGEDGKLLGVIYQSACHNTTLGGNFYGICGDFAGYSQAYIEEAFPGAQAMFMIGCAGDANPYPRDNELETSKKHGAELGTEVARLLQSPEKLQPLEGSLRTAYALAELPLDPLPTKEELSRMRLQPGGWRGWAAGEMEKYHEDGADPFPEIKKAPMAVWQFGDGLTLVGLSGEVVVDYVALIEEALGPLNLWVSAYCNEVYGYLPSARVLREGGYETRGLYYGIGFFKPEAEGVAVQVVKELADEVGRK